MSGEKSVRLSVLGDNSDAKRKIEEIDVKAEELKGLNPELKIGIDSAAASEKLVILKEEIKAAELSVEELTAAGEELKNAFPEISVGIDTAIAQEKLRLLKDQLKGVREQEAEVSAGAEELEVSMGSLTVPLDVAADKARDLEGNLVKASIALKITRDENGKLRDSSGSVITALEAESLMLGHLRNEAAEAALAMRELGKYEHKGFFSRIGGGGLGGIGKLFSSGNSIPGFGNIGSGVTSLLGGGPVAEAAGGGVSAVAALGVISAVVTEVGALATGLTAAGLGVGAFAALAVPALKNVSSEYGKLNAANQKYDQAVALQKLDPSKAHAAAVKSALDQVNLVGQAYGKLPGDEQGAVDGIYKLTRAFQAQAKALEPSVYKVFNEALKVANELLPYVGQFAQAAAPAIEHLVSGLGRFVSGGEFVHFMNFLKSLSGPVLEAVGSGFKGLAERVMIIMELFSKKDVINSVNIAFRLLGFTLSLVQGLIMEGMEFWDGLTMVILPGVAHAFDVTRHAIASFAHGVSHDFDDFRHNVAEFAHDVADNFDTVRHDVAEFGHDVAHYFDDSRHAVASVGHDFAVAFDMVRHALAEAGEWVAGHWKIIVGWIVAPIGMAVYEIRTHTHQIAASFDSARHNVAAAVGLIRHDVSSAFDRVRHDIAAVADWIPHAIRVSFDTSRHDIAVFADWLPHAIASSFDNARHDVAAATDWIMHKIRGGFGTVRHDVASALADVRHDIASSWDNARHSTAHFIDNLLTFFRRLPGNILSILSGLPGQMLKVGENIVEGLIHGIENAAGGLIGIMKKLAGDVVSYFTDPLKILSPSRVFMEKGKNIIQGATLGVEGESPNLLKTISRVASSVGASALGGGRGSIAAAVAGSGNRNAVLEVEWVGGGGADQEFITWLKKNIRIRGGNPAVLGR
jgi:phage-related protein